MVGYYVLEAQMKINKIFPIFAGLALIAASVCFAQEAARSECYVLDSQYRPNRDKSDEQCSVAACTSNYNPTAFSPEQANICAAENKKHPQPKSVWKVYTATNGARFRANIGTARRTQVGVIVMVQAIGVDPGPHGMIFNCRGYYLSPGDEDTGWLLAPPRSVVGVIAKDVCAKR
jgi:hypothetical protein